MSEHSTKACSTNSPEPQLLLLSTVAAAASTAGNSLTKETAGDVMGDEDEKKRGGRGRSFSINEDYIVAQAFLSASTDSVVGADQKQATFYETMGKRYTIIASQGHSLDMEHGLVDRSRSDKSLKNRWDIIRQTANIVHGVQDRKQTASGEDDAAWKERILPTIKKELLHSPSTVVSGRLFPYYFKVTDYLRPHAKFLGALLSSALASAPSDFATKPEARQKGRRAASRATKSEHLAEALKAAHAETISGDTKFSKMVSEHQKKMEEAILSMKRNREEQRQRQEEQEMKAERRHKDMMSMIQLLVLPEDQRVAFVQHMMSDAKSHPGKNK